jgi:hypothetical protein
MDVCHLGRTVGQKSSTHWLKGENSFQYKHFFGTTSAMEGPDRNLTSVLESCVEGEVRMHMEEEEKKYVIIKTRRGTGRGRK